jgi:catechol 2,3-dioxygenase-like lactoylglutathione lyase family enzyme
MDQRLSFVSLAVRDVARSRAFYVQGLGWREEMHVPGEVLMIQVGEHVVLSLWDRAHFEAEVGAPANDRSGEGVGVPPVTLAHNVTTPAEVDAVLATARTAGADPVHDGRQRDWGGYTGYFADPDGYHWEVAHNPGPIGELVLP